MRLFIVLLGLCLAPSAFGEINVEVGKGVFYTENTNFILVGFTEKNKPLFGIKSYHQFNLGGWDGPHNAAFAGVAKGLQWNFGQSYARLSSGVSLISNTSERLSTAFQFYEQLMVHYQLGTGGTSGVSIFYRHWSNAYIKEPNLGMDFAGIQVDYKW